MSMRPSWNAISLRHGTGLRGIQWEDPYLVAPTSHLDREAIIALGRAAVEEHTIPTANPFGRPDRTRRVTPGIRRTADVALLRGNHIRMRAQGASSMAPRQLQRSLGRRRVGLKVAASTAAVRRHRQPLMPLQFEPGPEAGFRSALDPGALSHDSVMRLIQDETGLHCGPTLSTCRFAVIHGVTSD